MPRWTINEIDEVSSTYSFTLFPSARRSPAPDVSFLLEICGVVDGFTAVRYFLRPRLAPAPDGLLSPLPVILPPPGESSLADGEK